MQAFTKRKTINFSIKKEFQLKLLFQILGIVLAGTLITSAVFYFYANREIGDSLRSFHVNARNFLDYLFPAVMVSGLAGFIIASIISLFFPHTFGGPFFRIERDLVEKVGEGDLTTRFYLRKGDNVKDLADSLNKMLDKLCAKMNDIETASENLKSLVSASNPPGQDKLREAQKSLAEKISIFKIKQ